VPLAFSSRTTFVVDISLKLTSRAVVRRDVGMGKGFAGDKLQRRKGGTGKMKRLGAFGCVDAGLAGNSEKMKSSVRVDLQMR
jgi:hypothetical protein